MTMMQVVLLKKTLSAEQRHALYLAARPEWETRLAIEWRERAKLAEIRWELDRVFRRRVSL
jgi:hypothetical protein